ncbi:MBL fold metallo-hydrolase [Propionicicella superfundia]|uniref:MBL fold metallo-hydrolase n=1 Tax=Propionicicella superfundia TaxID=348582 RepID=UPI000414A7C6|nr:MBL fold metallo-hydrolase [Propionicicella superfundia]
MASELSDWIRVTHGVWRLVAQPEHVNIGLVVGDTGALLIDTGSWPEQGRRIRERAAEVADVTHVVVTHRHYDHFFGLAAFTDLPTIGHASLEQDLADPVVLEEAFELRIDPAELVLPSQLVHLATTVDLGGVRAEIVHFGPGHTAGDLVVIVPEHEVVFAGDLLESLDPPQFGPESSIAAWPAALDGILGILGEDALIVPGHGDPVDRVFAFDQRARISALYGQAEYLVKQGVAEEDAWEKGDWPFPEPTVRAALPLLYAELAGKGLIPREQLPVRPLS